MRRIIPILALLIVTTSAIAAEKEFDWFNVSVGNEGNIRKQTSGGFGSDFWVRAVPDEPYLLVIGVSFGFEKERFFVFYDKTADQYADNTRWMPGDSYYKVAGTKKFKGKTLYYLEPVRAKK